MTRYVIYRVMFEMPASPQFISKQKAKARELRQSQWWKQKIAQGLCHYCQEKFKSTDLTMDHMIPIARGGHSDKANIVPCCKECNSKKKYYTPAELILKAQSLSEDKSNTK
jgi:5-methylcytosine-specific restriction enzyme A